MFPQTKFKNICIHIFLFFEELFVGQEILIAILKKLCHAPETNSVSSHLKRDWIKISTPGNLNIKELKKYKME